MRANQGWLRLWIVLSVAWVIGISSNCFAGEGFSSNRDLLPEAVRKVWDATFMVIPAADGGPASSFVVNRKDLGNGQAALYLLTNNHVVEANCLKPEGHCSNMMISATRQLKLYRDNATSRNMFKEMVYQPDATAKGVDILRTSKNPDLALVRIVVKNLKAWNVEPVKIAQNCTIGRKNRVYGIGFPDATTRTNQNALPIENPDILKRRWSEGYPVSYIENDREERLLGTTVDSLLYSSGGPLTTVDGDVIGVNTERTPAEGNAYAGDESSKPRKFHTQSVRCEYLAAFVAAGMIGQSKPGVDSEALSGSGR